MHHQELAPTLFFYFRSAQRNCFKTFHNSISKLLFHNAMKWDTKHDVDYMFTGLSEVSQWSTRTLKVSQKVPFLITPCSRCVRTIYSFDRWCDVKTKTGYKCWGRRMKLEHNRIRNKAPTVKDFPCHHTICLQCLYLCFFALVFVHQSCRNICVSPSQYLSLC